MTASPANVAAAAAMIAMVVPAVASAGCDDDDRPGTPNQLQAEPLAGSPASAIRFSWRNTTGKSIEQPRMWFDMAITDASGALVQNLTGVGPYEGIRYGSRSSRDFTGLVPNQTLCLRIRARTGPGTTGCISRLVAGPVCATTIAPSAPAPPGKPVRRLGKILGISATKASDGSITVRSASMRPNAPVTVRAADDALKNIYITSIGGAPLKSDERGHFSATFFGLCTAPGTLYISANDGRRSSTDKTGTLWTNTVTLAC